MIDNLQTIMQALDQFIEMTEASASRALEQQEVANTLALLDLLAGARLKLSKVRTILIGRRKSRTIQARAALRVLADLARAAPPSPVFTPAIQALDRMAAGGGFEVVTDPPQPAAPRGGPAEGAHREGGAGSLSPGAAAGQDGPSDPPPGRQTRPSLMGQD